MIKNQDETIRAAAKYDVLYNGFIHFYSRRSSTLRKGLYVAQDMIDLGLCLPTERTWSELLCGFLRHGDEKSAEKVWETMLQRNVEQSKAGWAFLLAKYDKAEITRKVREWLDERQMPEGLEQALEWRGSAAETLSSAVDEKQLVRAEYEAEEEAYGSEFPGEKG